MFSYMSLCWSHKIKIYIETRIFNVFLKMGNISSPGSGINMFFFFF